MAFRLTWTLGTTTLIDLELFTQDQDEEEQTTTIISLGGDFTHATEPEPESWFTDDTDRFGFR